MKTAFKFNSLIILIALTSFNYQKDRGEVGTDGNKFIWTGTGQAFVPNYAMIDMLTSDLGKINKNNLDWFIDEFINEHGFTGVHVPVYGQWFHIGDKKVTEKDSIPDQRTFDKLKMIITEVYDAGGCTHLWVWGDHSRRQTSKSTKDGIMGRQEKMLMDKIAEELGPLKGWTMGYGFDLWEWVSEEELDTWHDYMWSKKGWDQLMGARSQKNELEQISEKMDYSSYEYHKPSHNELVAMINTRPEKPSFSEDRYRIRYSSNYPEKDYNEEETVRGLWHHTMAGGVAAIWGNLEEDGVYSNRESLKCFSEFWNDEERFKKDMEPDNALTNGYCLREGNRIFVYYIEDSDVLEYSFKGKKKDVIAIDTRKEYREIPLGRKTAGEYVFEALYKSDWAIAAE